MNKSRLWVWEPGSEYQLCCLLAMVKWVSYLTSLDLSLLLYKMDITWPCTWLIVRVKTDDISEHA